MRRTDFNCICKIWVLCSQIVLLEIRFNRTYLEYISLHSRIRVESFSLNTWSPISEQANDTNLIIGKAIKILKLFNTNG